MEVCDQCGGETDSLHTFKSGFDDAQDICDYCYSCISMRNDTIIQVASMMNLLEQKIKEELRK